MFQTLHPVRQIHRRRPLGSATLASCCLLSCTVLTFAAPWSGTASGAGLGDDAAAQQAPPAAAPQAAPPTGNELRERVEALEAQLKAAQERIRQLEAELEAARRAGAASPASGPEGAADPAADQSADQAAPPADDAHRIATVAEFLDKAKGEYAAAFAPKNPGDKPAPPRQRDLDRFVQLTNRTWRQELRWNVQVLKWEKSGDGVVLTTQPLNEDGSAHGDAVPMLVESRHLRRLEVVFQRAQANDVFLVKGVFSPRLAVNMQRMEPGVFNNPPLVGPGVEMRYDIAVQGISKVQPKAKEGEHKGKPGEKVDGGTAPQR